MIQLGTNEDKFLLSSKETYGPVVYVPWPLGQVFVLEGDAIQRIYSAPPAKLSFLPIRISVQATVFGSSNELTYGPILPKLFPVHARGMGTTKLAEPVARFTKISEEFITKLGGQIDENGGTLELDIVAWIRDTMFFAASAALFGEDFMRRGQEASLQPLFNDFDQIFGLLSSEMIPSFLFKLVGPIDKGVKGRAQVWKVLEGWIEDGMPGLEEGVIRDIAELPLKEGVSAREVASRSVHLTDLC
jgi:hypothetical protein